MSKTKGNVVDPLETIGEYGADALRFSLVTGVTPGQDVPLAKEKMEANRNFCNKLWNAARFLEPKLEAVGAVAPVTAGELATLPTLERALISKAHACAEASAESLEKYAIGDAGRRAYEFFYDEFCDWYVEISKTRPEGDAGATRALSYGFDVSLKLLHPFMPYVTEFLWQKLFVGDALVVAPYPAVEGESLPVDDAAVATFESWKGLVRSLRNIRAEYDVEPKRKLGPVIVCADAALAAVIVEESAALALLAKVDPARLVVVRDAPAGGGAGDESVQLVVADGLEVFIPKADLARDAAKERARLEKQGAKLDKEVAGLEGRLNPGFVAKAPADVVAATKATLDEKRDQRAAVDAALADLGA